MSTSHTPSSSHVAPMTGSMTGLSKDHRLYIKVIEAKGFAPEHQDTQCVVRIDNNTATQFKTKTVWKSQSPFYDEEYEFTLDEQFTEFYVEIYNKNKFTKDAYIGLVTIPKLSLELGNNVQEAWFPIFLPNSRGDDSPATPTTPTTASDVKRPHTWGDKYFAVPRNCDHCTRLIWKSQAFACGECGFVCHAKCQEQCKPTCGTRGALRLRYRYTNEFVLPLPAYSKLLELIMADNMELVTIYGRVTDDREEAAKTLLRIMEYANLSVTFVNALNSADVRGSEEKTIFRANSIASKALDYYMKFIGMEYLFSVLKPIMDEIIKQERSCEIDPTRLEKGEDLEANKVVLLAYIEWTVGRIFESVADCPAPLRQVFAHLQEEVTKKYPDNEDLRYTCVSGYLFLRFFAAAILGPKLFGLTADHPSQRNSRTLTLISKTVQQLANLLHFDGKEPFMGVLNDFMNKNKDKMRLFIKKIATVADTAGKKEKKESLLDKIAKKKSKGSGSQETSARDSINIRYELASMYRLLARSRPRLEDINKQTPQDCLKKLMEVLNGMEAITQKKRKEAEEEREREAQSALDAEQSLEEFLGLPKGDIKKNYVQKFMKQSTSMDLKKAVTVTTEKIDLDTEVSDVKFVLKPGCEVGMREVFSLCDRTKTGSISREDFEIILLSQNLNLQSDDVMNAHRAADISPSAEAVTYVEFSKVVLRLENRLRNPAPRDEVRDACTALLKQTGGGAAADGRVNLAVLNTLIDGSGKGALTDAQLRRLNESLKKQSADGAVDLVAMAVEL